MPGAKLRSSNLRVDIVVIAARYGSDRQLRWVQAFERRGKVWGDKVLLDRRALSERLQAKKRVHAGSARSIPGDFDLGPPIRLVGHDGAFSIVAQGLTSVSDDLGVPLV